MTPVRLEYAAPPSQVKHSTTEPLRSLPNFDAENIKRFTVITVNVGYLTYNSFPASDEFCRLLITFAKSLDPNSVSF